jgi:CopG family transcriptional regulator/antitoxin EndoAI
MSNLKKIIISLPGELLGQTDCSAKEQRINRSELIRRALYLYLAEYKKDKIRKELISGYEEMKELNLSLAEEGMNDTLKDIEEYEAKLI